jgi:hypothetical protein
MICLFNSKRQCSALHDCGSSVFSLLSHSPKVVALFEELESSITSRYESENWKVSTGNRNLLSFILCAVLAGYLPRI